MSTLAIGQNQSRVFWLPGNNESFECSIDNNARNSVHYSKCLQALHIAMNEDEIIQINHEACPKSTKRQASGALLYFPVNKISKDIGVLHLLNVQ